jgi:biopolymer transport protein ExbD
VGEEMSRSSKIYGGDLIVSRYVRNRRNRRSGININVVPLVDVLLVLIAIFMIASPAMNTSVSVDLPKTKAATVGDYEENPIVISINKDSRIFLGDSEVSMPELLERIQDILRAKGADCVHVRGDKNLPYGEIMRLIEIISSSGGCKVSLVSDQAEDIRRQR